MKFQVWWVEKYTREIEAPNRAAAIAECLDNQDNADYYVETDNVRAEVLCDVINPDISTMDPNEN